MTALEQSTIDSELNKLPNWSFREGFITTTISCGNFKEAFALMTRIAFEAEALEHHPNWENVYNTINIKLRTHDVDGITTNDFNFAKRIESLRP